MAGFLHRYVDDPSAPRAKEYWRDIAVRGLLPALVLLALVYVIGEFVLPFDGVSDEAALNQQLQAGRTPASDLLAYVVSHAAGVVGAPLTALIAFFWIRRATGQWWLGLVPLVSVALEALVYQTATVLVGRKRPDGVEQMDFGLPDGSFPSGHVGAATCLVLVFALLAWSSRHSTAFKVAVSVAGVVWVVAVALSRLYLGMHHVSDAVAGVVIGALCALLGWNALRRSPGRARQRGERA